MMRNRLVRSVLLAMAVVCGASSALAQKPAGLPGNYPSKPVRVIVGSSAGGGTDIIARLIISRLADRWGHTFITENMASGIGGVVAMDVLVKAAPDGYTLLVSSNSAVVNTAVVSRANAAYDVRTAVVPVAQFTSQPYILIAANSLPVNSMAELLGYVRARPGELNYASGGVGTSGHIGIEMLKLSAGLNMVHVPYKGVAPSLIDLMAGRVQMVLSGVLSAVPMAKAGKAKALAVTSAKRFSLLPDLPTLAESGVPGFELVGWYGLLGPANLPGPVLSAINRGVQEVLRLPEVQQKLAADGAEAPLASPEQFRQTMLSEIDKVARLIKDTGLKLE